MTRATQKHDANMAEPTSAVRLRHWMLGVGRWVLDVLPLTLLALLVIAIATPSRADVIICKALKDTSLDKGSPDNSNGGGPAFFSGTDGDPNPHRALLCFDLSGVPAGATITDVQLT